MRECIRVDLRHLRAFVTIVDAGGFAPGRRPAESQPAGAVAADPRPRGRAGRPALRPHRAARPAHRRGRGPAAARPRTADGRRLARRAGARPQGRTGRRAARGRHAAGDGDAARRLPRRATGGGTPASRCTSSRMAASGWPAPRAGRRPPRAHGLHRCAVPLAARWLLSTSSPCSRSRSRLGRGPRWRSEAIRSWFPFGLASDLQRWRRGPADCASGARRGGKEAPAGANGTAHRWRP